MVMSNLSVVIGRFQPFHTQHLELVKEAINVTGKVLICIGSTNQHRTLKNPFTYDERKVIITTTLMNAGVNIHNVSYLSLEDKPTDEEWAEQIYTAVDDSIVTLVGFHKDDSSYYLDSFPDFLYHEYKSESNLSATIVRQRWYNGFPVGRDMIDVGVARLLGFTREQEWYKNLHLEATYVLGEKNKFKDYPYKSNLNICTADAMIVNDNDEVLLIRRGGHPHKGLLALAGGHKESDETFLQCALREACEETNVPVDKLFQRGEPFVCDNPDRDPCLTKVSIAYHFHLSDTTGLTAQDDADSIHWIPLEDIDNYREEIAFDHYDIIKNFTQYYN